MPLICPDCHRTIPLDDVNVGKDLALCRGCGATHSYADLVGGAVLETTADLQNPPPGAWYRREGMETTMGATHRALGMALGALAIAAFWNGIVSIFVAIAVGATLERLNIGVPEWFPGPKMKGGDVPFGGVIFLWLFLTPFIAVGTGMLWAVANFLAGRTTVRITGGEAVVFTGIGPLGWRRKFDAGAVEKVTVEQAVSRANNGNVQSVVVVTLRGGKPIRFGSSLREDRRTFIAGALRKSL
jgi:hypothetical protein